MDALLARQKAMEQRIESIESLMRELVATNKSIIEKSQSEVNTDL